MNETMALCDLMSPRQILLTRSTGRWQTMARKTWEDARHDTSGFGAEMKLGLAPRRTCLIALFVCIDGLILHIDGREFDPLSDGIAFELRRFPLVREFRLRGHGGLHLHWRYFYSSTVDPFGPEHDDFFEYVLELSGDNGFERLREKLSGQRPAP